MPKSVVGCVTRCPHISSASQLTSQQLVASFQKNCVNCCTKGRWLCLNDQCHVILCGSKGKNHSDTHYQETGHPLQLMLGRKSTSVWCNRCDIEVNPQTNNPRWQMGNSILAHAKRVESVQRIVEHNENSDLAKVVNAPSATPNSNSIVIPSVHGMRLRSGNKSPLDSPMGRGYIPRETQTIQPEPQIDIRTNVPRGVTGLRNLGNTCYLNSAVQALSNCTPLSEFMRHRPLQCNQPPIVAHRFQNLLIRLWTPNKNNSISPFEFIQAFTDIYKANFRQFQQHDSQEFLRCFLDRMHTELKYPLYEWQLGERNEDDDRSADDCTEAESSSQEGSQEGSQDSFETADSGWSSERETDATQPRFRTRKRVRNDSEGSAERIDKRKIKFNKYSVKQVPKRRPTVFRSIINDVFDGKVQSTVTCLTCHHVSETKETFQDLSLAIPSSDHVAMMRNCAEQENASQGGDVTKQGWLSWMYDWSIGWFISQDRFFGPEITLHDCLHAFFAKDELKGEDMYNCEKCKKLRNGVRQCSLLTAPEVLMVHLKRFRHEQYSTKVSTRVNFPLTGLDLAPFMHKNSDSSFTKYDLSSVICHYGGAEGGHYTAYCLNSDTESWHEYDDAYVTQVDQLQVLSLTSEAYVLFYKKVEDRTSMVLAGLNQEIASKQRRILDYYISADWLTKLNSFAEPGPITNFDFLCPHGCCDPRKQQLFPDLYAKIPPRAWDFLYERYGGGPSCTNLVHCNICQPEMMQVERRRNEEENMLRNHERACKQMPSRPYNYRLIDTNWFKQWEAFVLKYQIDPPGAITNQALLTKCGLIRLGASSVTLSVDGYNMLQKIYGGGPDVVNVMFGQPQPTPIQIQCAENEWREKMGEKMNEDPIVTHPEENDIEMKSDHMI